MGSEDRFRPDRGWVDPKELPTGPNGKPKFGRTRCRLCVEAREKST